MATGNWHLRDASEQRSIEAGRPERAPLLSLRDIRRVYDSSTGDTTEALASVDLDVYPGEFVVIRGESGSGKTTLLRIVGFLDQGFDGQYSFDGQEINGRPGWWLDEVRAHNIGFVFQEGRLFEHLTLADNILLPSRLADGAKGNLLSLPELTAEATHFFTLKELDQRILERSSAKASGGQRQRAAIWRALSTKPSMVLADEPTASLDENKKRHVKQLLIDAAAEGFTVIVVTHDEIFFDVGRQLMMRDGRLTPVSVDGCARPDGIAQNGVIAQSQTAFSALRTLRGWWPRAGLDTLMRQVWRETFLRPVFLLLVLVALVAGICQIAICASLLIGTQDFVDYSIKNGSRLNRIQIKPRSENRPKPDRFPDRRQILAKPNVEAVVGRREGTVRLVTNSGSTTPYTAMGLHQDDPEYKLLYFLAGDFFASPPRELELIVTSALLVDLFDPAEFKDNEVGLDRFVGRPVVVEIPTFTRSGRVRKRFRVTMRIAGVISKAEGGRQLYLPNTTLKAFDQVKRDRSGTKRLPLNKASNAWAVSGTEVDSFAEFPWEDRLHVYTMTVRDVIPVFHELAQIGYRPQSDIWKFKWVLDIQDIAWNIFVPLLALIVLVVGLTVGANIFSSAKIREKEFALWRILGMRIGDLSFTQVTSTTLMVIVGSLLGIAVGMVMVNQARALLSQQYEDAAIEMIFAPVLSFAPHIVAGAVLVGVAAAFLPARHAARTDPAKILQSH